MQDYHYAKPHRALSQRDQQTRFLGSLRDRLWRSLRHVPVHFRLDDSQSTHGSLQLPVAAGGVSWIRKVDTEGRIEVNGKSYFIRRRLSGQDVVATLLVRRSSSVIKHEGRRIKVFPFPIPSPWCPPCCLATGARGELAEVHDVMAAITAIR